MVFVFLSFFFSSRRRHTRSKRDWSSDVCSSDLRHKPSVERVVMAYFGVQTRGAPSTAAEQAMAQIASCFESNGGPAHWDRARYIDEAGFTNVVTVAYWAGRAKFDGWFPAAREGWTGDH